MEHYAQRAVGADERITMVQAYIMDDWRVRDDTSLRAGRMYSHRTELEHQWAVYRLEALAKRAVAMKVKHTDREQISL